MEALDVFSKATIPPNDKRKVWGYPKFEFVPAIEECMHILRNLAKEFINVAKMMPNFCDSLQQT